MLGNNMFAYCLSNPVKYYDPWGYNALLYRHQLKNCSGLENDLGGAVVALGVGLAAATATTAVSANSHEVYEYSKSLVDQTVSIYEDSQPRVHHVIPRGDFSGRSSEVQNNMKEMHKLLASVGMTVEDPENLLIMSQGTHKSMHTDQYIYAIYSIMKKAESGNEWSVRWYLYLARTYAASLDRYPRGY